MSSSFGNSLRVTLFGESHGAAIGMTLDGFPAGLHLDMEALQAFLARRAPGGSLQSGRKETDLPEFLSGLRGDVTCGSPITAIIRNQDAHSEDYTPYEDIPRPGHADYSAFSKYGCTEDQIAEGYRQLMRLGVQNFGIHSFLVSNTIAEDYYPTLARTLFTLAVRLHERTGAHISFINLSGGIGIPYRPNEKKVDIRKVGEEVRKVYEEVLVPAGMGDVALFTELGRFMMGPYGELVVKAIHEKHIYKEYIGVDGCAVNLMRPAMYRAYHHITVLGKEAEKNDHIYDVVGSLCENNDKFAIDRELPRIDIGDYLSFMTPGRMVIPWAITTTAS